MKQFGLRTEELITAWKSIIQPNTEYAVPLRHSGLTTSDCKRLERLQKIVLGIILGTTYDNFIKYYKIGNKTYRYEEALQVVGLSTLWQRREDLTNNFALQTAKNPLHNALFPLNSTMGINTRNKPVFCEYSCRTNRYFKSAIPDMARRLNRLRVTK